MEVGTGWIGWTEEQTLNTSMVAIHAALKGRRSMLRAIFGGDDPDSASISENQKPVKLVSQLAALAKARGKGK